jgi:hypothetical protein
MIGKPKVVENGRTVTVRVPISIRKRGGRKLVFAPNGQHLPGASASRHVDNAIVKAIARAFRWRQMLDGGEYSTIREIAAAEKINESYVCRVLRLTLLAPLIVERLLNGRQPPGLILADLLRPMPTTWDSQIHLFDLPDFPRCGTGKR